MKELEYSKSIQNNIQKLTLLMIVIPTSLGLLVSEVQISQIVYPGLIVSFNFLFSILYDWFYLYPERQLGVKLELSMINSHLVFLFIMNMLGVRVISKKYFNITLIFNVKLVTVIMMLALVEYLTWKLIIIA